MLTAVLGGTVTVTGRLVWPPIGLVRLWGGLARGTGGLLSGLAWGGGRSLAPRLRPITCCRLRGRCVALCLSHTGSVDSNSVIRQVISQYTAHGGDGRGSGRARDPIPVAHHWLCLAGPLGGAQACRSSLECWGHQDERLCPSPLLVQSLCMQHQVTRCASLAAVNKRGLAWVGCLRKPVHLDRSRPRPLPIQT
jgi:hypothetical protein